MQYKKTIVMQNALNHSTVVYAYEFGDIRLDKKFNSITEGLPKATKEWIKYHCGHVVHGTSEMVDISEKNADGTFKYRALRR